MGIVKKCILVTLLMVPVLLSSQQLGLGVIIGSPTGLALKYALGRTSAFAAHAGWSFIGDAGLHLTADYQHHFPMVIRTAEGTSISNLSPYIAAGGRFRFKEHAGDNEFNLGMRIGGGMEYMMARFGIFLEVVPVVNLIPETNFDLEGGLGFLFYF